MSLVHGELTSEYLSTNLIDLLLAQIAAGLLSRSWCERDRRRRWNPRGRHSQEVDSRVKTSDEVSVIRQGLCLCNF